ncbi:MAG: NAD(P)-dependent oxidoreductase [Solirubrobacteraceae bacterium]
MSRPEPEPDPEPPRPAPGRPPTLVTDSPRPRVGFIGLGIMGGRMAANLARAGFELTVWNRTRETAERFAADHAAGLAESPAALAARSDLVITMVVDGDQVETVLLGPDGVAGGASPGLLCVDCSTIGRAAATRIGQALADRGIRLLDAPVTGSAPRAADATLTIMAGGARADFDRARPVLGAMGRLVLHVGPLGHGQTIKLINNSVAAANALTVAEALVVATDQGVDLDALVAVMEAGSGGSAMLALKQSAMRAHDFAPLFKLDHMLKDVRLCLAAAGVPFEAADAAAQALEEAAALGHGDDDFAAMLAAVEHRAGHLVGEASSSMDRADDWPSGDPGTLLE